VSTVLLSTRGLAKVYRSEGVAVEAVRGVDIEVGTGEFVAIMGPSGSGKSTLLHILGGLEPATRGEIWLRGRRVDKLSTAEWAILRRRHVGFVFQFFNLLSNMTVADNVELPALLAGATPRQARRRREELLGELGLAGMAGAAPARLSGGEQQRVALARALANEPSLLLADEPIGCSTCSTGWWRTTRLCCRSRVRSTASATSWNFTADRPGRPMRGTLRWARADLRARRGQALITVVVAAGVVAALVLATMLLEGATNPWQSLFARTHGADMVVYFSYGTDTGKLSRLPGVRNVDGPFQAAPATLEQGPVKSPVQLTAMGQTRPPMSTPLVVAGTWLRPSAPRGVVVEASFAAAAHVGVGDQISVQSVDASAVRMTVIGIADTADQGFYPQWTPGLIWVPQPVLAAVEPATSEREYVVGLRLADAAPVAAGQVAQEIYNAYNGPSESSVVLRFSTSQQVENSMASDDRLLGLLLALFGIIALGAALCAIANVTAGQVLMHRQDIAMLKALGFTPGQVVRMLLAEQTVLGVAGALCGVALARVVTSPEFTRPPDGTSVGLAPLPGSWVTLIAAGTVLTVAIATVIPAWRAGLVSPVAAVQASPPRGHLSLIARLSLLIHLPAPLVLGVRDSLTRRLPALLTVFGVAIPMMMITIALTCWSTIDGLAAALSVSGPASTSVLARDPQVLAAYPAAAFDTLLPGDNGTFTALAAGTSARPYPFHVADGRLFGASDEAVAGQGFLNLMHLSVGDLTGVTVDGVYVDVRIVGRIIYPDDNGDVLAFGLDALRVAGNPQPPQFYDVVLRPGVSAIAASEHLLRTSQNQLDVQLVPNPADGLGIVRVVIAVSVVILAVIGLANLLTATAIGLRDHQYETSVLAAMGLTPRQVMATLVVNTTILATLGVGAGLVAGAVAAPWLINMQGQSSGMGAGIASAPSLLMVAAIAGVALLVATTAAVGLARRTLRLSDPAAQLRGSARPARRTAMH
jgi:putative ABC transport system permease protein